MFQTTNQIWISWWKQIPQGVNDGKFSHVHQLSPAPNPSQDAVGQSTPLGHGTLALDRFQAKGDLQLRVSRLFTGNKQRQMCVYIYTNSINDILQTYVYIYRVSMIYYKHMCIYIVSMIYYKHVYIYSINDILQTYVCIYIVSMIYYIIDHEGLIIYLICLQRTQHFNVFRMGISPACSTWRTFLPAFSKPDGCLRS